MRHGEWPSKHVFDDARQCGVRYMVDAADDLPPDESKDFVLELFYNSITEMSIMLVLVQCGGRQTFRRIGICFISKSSLVEPLQPMELVSNVILV